MELQNYNFLGKYENNSCFLAIFATSLTNNQPLITKNV